MTDAPARTRALEKALVEHLNNPICLEITDNRRRMLTYRSDGERMRVRVHRMFLMANESTVRDLAAFIRDRDNAASQRISEFVNDHMHLVKPDPANGRAHGLNCKGKIFDLQLVFDDLNQRYFGNACIASIGWGRGSVKKAKRSVRLGSYYAQERVIRIHPILDNPRVPDYFIGWVVYHEMLHDLIGADGGPGRYHTQRFRKAEAAYPDAFRAAQWEQVNLPYLLGRKKRPHTPSDECPAGPLFAPWRLPGAFD
ncbi:MAG: hypothetical protein P9M14_00615 [Candidatus Alcyoniella australis]|nr:hypothetical protein [Candidatus Alcyoniella australis]